MAKRKPYKPGGTKPAGSGLGTSAYKAPKPGAWTNPYESAVPPPDPALEAYRVSAMRNSALSDASATYQLGGIENQYGLGSDTSNPFSQAKLLQENYLRSQRGTTNSYAAQGQVNSSAYQRMQGENSRNYTMGYDQASRAYTGAKQNVLQGQLGAYANSQSGIDEATFNSLLRKLSGG